MKIRRATTVRIFTADVSHDACPNEEAAFTTWSGSAIKKLFVALVVYPKVKV